MSAINSALEDELKPMCAVCGHEVERIEAVQDFRLDRTIIVAICHGKEQVVTIDRDFLFNNKIERGVAFSEEQKQISEQKCLTRSSWES
jgi:hypothetical protein